MMTHSRSHRAGRRPAIARTVALWLFFLLLAFGVRPTALSAPANDNFANAATLTGVTNFLISNIGATIEPGEPSHAGQPAEASLWWKWTAPFTGTFRVVTSNSVSSTGGGLDTVVAVYTGSSVSNLIQIVSNDDTAYGEFGAVWSRVVFRAYAGEVFMIAAGSLAATGTIRMEVDVGGPFLLPWQTKDLQGQYIYSTNYSGKLTLIDFWETICGACVEELPDLIQLQTLLQPRGFTIVGLSGDQSVQTVIDYVSGKPINYPIAMGPAQVQISIAGSEIGFPTKRLIDQEGRAVGTYTGGNTLKGYRTLLEPLLRTNSQVRVRISRVGASIRLFWPAAETTYVLQEGNTPTGPWSDVSATPFVINDELAVTLPGSAQRGYYRLIKR